MRSCHFVNAFHCLNFIPRGTMIMSTPPTVWRVNFAIRRPWLVSAQSKSPIPNRGKRSLCLKLSWINLQFGPISLSTNFVLLSFQLVAVVVSFFLCWAPFHIQRMFAILVGSEPTDPQVNLYNLLTNISGVTYYLSATINPILYSILSLKFRTAFKETLHQVVTGIGFAI